MNKKHIYIIKILPNTTLLNRIRAVFLPKAEDFLEGFGYLYSWNSEDMIFYVANGESRCVSLIAFEQECKKNNARLLFWELKKDISERQKEETANIFVKSIKTKPKLFDFDKYRIDKSK